MDAKMAKIILYVASWFGFGGLALIIFGLAFKDLFQDEGYKQHFNQLIICNIALYLLITSPVALVFLIWGFIKVLQGDDSPLPLIGGWRLIK